MLTFLWLLSSVAAAIAVAALIKGRRVAKRLERLTESYWELRYECGQLRSRLAKIEPGEGGDAPEPSPAPGTSHFVPLSSLRR